MNNVALNKLYNRLLQNPSVYSNETRALTEIKYPVYHKTLSNTIKMTNLLITFFFFLKNNFPLPKSNKEDIHNNAMIKHLFFGNRLAFESRFNIPCFSPKGPLKIILLRLLIC